MSHDILPYPPTGSKGIVYARRSAPGERDQDESIASQVKRGQDWLREQGYEVVPAVEDYADGDSWNFYRDKLQELLRRARNHEFAVVVVAAKDRLSRKAEHRPVIRFFLHEAGVKLHSLRPQEAERDEPFAGIIEAIQDEQDEQERVKIRERLNVGKLHRASQQKLMASAFPLYGYRWADPNVKGGKSRYLENPDTAPAVRYGFYLAKLGKTLTEIAVLLTEAGYPPPMYYRKLCGRLPRNKAPSPVWTYSSVYTLLTEPKYRGEYVANRTRTVKEQWWDDVNRKWVTRKMHLVREADDPLRLTFTEPTCPPLVDDATWYAVQALMQRNKITSSRNLRDPEAALLAGGFLICGFCRTYPFQVFYASDRNCYRYGAESSRHKQADGTRCPGFGTVTPCAELDKAVWTEVIRAFEQPDILRRQYDLWEAQAGETYEEEQLAAFRKKRQDALEEQENCLKIIKKLKDGEHAADLLAAEISQISERIASYDEEISRLEETLQNREAGKEELERLLAAGKEALDRMRVMPHAEKRRLLSAVGFRVGLFPASAPVRFVLYWPLAQVQIATLRALGNAGDDSPPDADAATFHFDTKSDPTLPRSFRRAQ